MRILHTSDWHIGKRLMGRERLQEQVQVLDEIARICEEEKVELLLVAGDIFDTYTPSAEAEDLFFRAVKKLASPDRAVLMISGNHDDGVRLSASAPVCEELGVYVVGNARAPIAPTRRGSVYPVQSGKGYVVFEKGEDKVYVATLPYPNEARFKEEKAGTPFAELMQKWFDECTSGNTEKLPSVLLAHIFVAGGLVSDSEREIDLGGARAVARETLPPCDYVALGHLHKKQKMGANVYYSGSPLQYSFDERTEKSVQVFDLTSLGVENLKEISLRSGRPLVRLEAASVEDGLRLLDTYPETYVELKLLLDAPLLQSQSASLSAKENLVSLLTEIRNEEKTSLQSRKGLTDEELLNAYYRSKFDREPKEELKTLFLSLLQEE
ncbi:MAG: exonuclease subunit SbcD [Clostridia bacterium]|nr:exonuclease subunit SbcD [Clostridia bacterium]